MCLILGSLLGPWETPVFPEGAALGGLAVRELVPHFDRRRRFRRGRDAVQGAVGGRRFARGGRGRREPLLLHRY